MKKSLFQKVLCLILSVTTLLGLFAVTVFAAKSPDQDYLYSNNDTASTKDEMTALVGIPTYAEYCEKYDALFTGNERDKITIDVISDIVKEETTLDADGNPIAQPVSKHPECADYDSESAYWANFGVEKAEDSLYLPATGKTTWRVPVQKGAQGYYYLKFEYYSCKTGESSVSSIERKLLVNGKAPFKEASYITFDKSWSYNYGTEVNDKLVEKDTVWPVGEWVTYETRDDGYYKITTTVRNEGGVNNKYVREHKIAQDINGNSMLPEAIENPDWHTYYSKDSTGYYQGYFKFFFLEDSEYQISLVAEREPIVIKSIELIPVDAVDSTSGDYVVRSYADYIKYYKDLGYAAADGSAVRLEAEFPDLVSDSSVYAGNSNASSATYPSAPNAQLYNIIGENSYSAVGQWAAYKFTVSDTGFYKIGMRYLQDQLQGMYICRSIKLTGGKYGNTPVNPFEEAHDAQFGYSKEWVSSFVGNGGDNEFEFAFEAGEEYTLYLECSLGLSLKSIIQRVENALNDLNADYLRILQLTGSAPDEYRDYGFMSIMPEVVMDILEKAKILDQVKNDLIDLCGTTGSHVATLETVAILLDTMGSSYGDNIAANLSNFKSYLGTLGTWINDSKKGTLILDTITICPSGYDEEELPEAKAGFFSSMWFEITSFIYSFFTDYESMGLTKDPSEGASGGTIDVWLASGRDQSNIWRTMIDADNGFTDSTGYGVALKLVTAGTLLPSILSGKGPDIYMGLGAADVINYAIREAVIGINGNDTRYFNEDNRNLDDNKTFTTTYYIYKDVEGDYHYDETDRAIAEANAAPGTKVFVSDTFENVEADNYAKAATDTLELGGVVYGVPQTMGFSMMFYRMDVLAELGLAVPETWGELLSILPTLQSNNMQIGVSYTLALEFMIYQKGGNMWKYEDENVYDSKYAGAAIDLDSDIALESFEFVCRLYSDYSFPVSYDAANRFRTGEMPIVIGDYTSTYNTLVVYATELDGMWEFCPLPGSELRDEYGNVLVDEESGKKLLNYNSLANVSATVMLNGCDNVRAAWAYLQWQTSADVQSNYGNKMVALIGPSAKYEAANINAIKDLSWTASEKEAIENQMAHLSSIVNYPGSYIMGRYMGFAFLDAVNAGADPVDSLSQYIDEINDELTRKRKEFNLPTADEVVKKDGSPKD